MGSNREKNNIAFAILEKLPFLRAKKIYILHFDGSNNIFANCISYLKRLKSFPVVKALWVAIGKIHKF